jgi:hypothetical protein
VRGRCHYRRRSARCPVPAQALRTGPACGPSAQPVSKSYAQQDADAYAESGRDTDGLAEPLAGGRTDTGCLADIQRPIDADAHAVS